MCCAPEGETEASLVFQLDKSKFSGFSVTTGFPYRDYLILSSASTPTPGVIVCPKTKGKGVAKYPAACSQKQCQCQCKKEGCTWDAHTKTCSDPGHEAAAQKVKPVDTNVVIQEPDFSNSGSTVLLNVVMMLANVVMMMLILFGVHF